MAPNGTGEGPVTTPWPEMAGIATENLRHRRAGFDELLVVALARGDSFADAAAVAGMSERTARRRAGDPEIVAAVEHLRAEMVRRAAARLEDGLDRAVTALLGLLESDTDAVRFRAANAVIERCRSLRELVSIEDRLVAVEGALEAGKDDAATRWLA